MHVESGGYVVSEMTVTDRATGELGASTRFIGAGDAARELALEVSYGTSFLDGQARAGAFLRAEGAMAGGTRETVDHMIGGQLSFGF
jgi:L-2-hydroxyglutarate oxidase LhgO